MPVTAKANTGLTSSDWLPWLLKSGGSQRGSAHGLVPCKVRDTWLGHRGHAARRCCRGWRGPRHLPQGKREGFGALSFFPGTSFRRSLQRQWPRPRRRIQLCPGRTEPQPETGPGTIKGNVVGSGSQTACSSSRGWRTAPSLRHCSHSVSETPPRPPENSHPVRTSASAADARYPPAFPSGSSPAGRWPALPFG